MKNSMIPNIEERPKTGFIPVTLDYAPEENGKEFDEWCEKYGFTPLGSGRRAWCESISTYFRDALGVAENPSGDIFLFDKSDLETHHHQLQEARQDLQTNLVAAIEGDKKAMSMEINISNEYKLGYRQALDDTITIINSIFKE